MSLDVRGQEHTFIDHRAVHGFFDLWINVLVPRKGHEHVSIAARSRALFKGDILMFSNS